MSVHSVIQLLNVYLPVRAHILSICCSCHVLLCRYRKYCPFDL